MRGLFQLKRLLHSLPLSNVSRRLLLSQSYNCTEVWKTRLSTPVLQQVNVGEFAMQLQNKFDKEGAASAVDIDILANKLENIDLQQIDFALNLLERHRRTRECLEMSDSTPYAIVRSLLALGEKERLLNIIQDKIKYGIFLDSYTCNMLLDHFIENKQYQEAAIIAYDQMLQEDFSDELTKALSWYACHLHWKNLPIPVEENTQVEEANEEEEKEEEEVYIRVGFIENPYYDDHFDIPKDSMKLGKTLTMLAAGDETTVGRSYALVGWGLYEKFDEGLELLNQVSKLEGANVSTDALESFMNTLESIETKEPPEEPIEIGMLMLEDLYPYVTQQQKDEYLQRAKELESSLKSSNKVIEYTLEEQLLTSLKDIIKEKESVDIKAQTELFSDWNKARENILAKQIESYKIQKKKEAIGYRILELQKREEKLRYFEEQERISLGIARAAEIKPVDDVFKEEQYVATPVERIKGF